MRHKLRYLACILSSAAIVALLGGAAAYSGHHGGDLPRLLAAVLVVMVGIGTPGVWLIFRGVARYLSVGRSGVRGGSDVGEHDRGVERAGNDLAEVERVAGEIERAVSYAPGVSSVLAERERGSRYIDVSIDRSATARYGLNGRGAPHHAFSTIRARGRVLDAVCARPQLSVAGIVRFIALAGVAAEFGVVMLIHLKQTMERPGQRNLLEAIDEGAVARASETMTVAVIVSGMIPIMWSDGAGSEVMQRIAVPMIGGI